VAARLPRRHSPLPFPASHPTSTTWGALKAVVFLAVVLTILLMVVTGLGVLNTPVSYIDTGGPGRPALFVHGLATSSYLWRHVIEQFEGQRRCVAVDLPLHGQTPAAADQDFSPPGLAGFVAEFCDTLGLTGIDLVANDTGGAICQAFAAGHPERLHTLEPLFGTATRARQNDRILPSLHARDLLAIEPALARLQVPTLIVWGTGDRFFHRKWAYWLRDTIPGASEVVEIDGGRLFFPDERAAELTPLLRRHWETAP